MTQHQHNISDKMFVFFVNTIHANKYEIILASEEKGLRNSSVDKYRKKILSFVYTRKQMSQLDRNRKWVHFLSC